MKLLTERPRRYARRYGYFVPAAAAIVVALAVESMAQTGSGWVLMVPPRIREQEALIKVLAADSVAEMNAAVSGLSGEESLHLLAKVHKIIDRPTVADRMEALSDALHDDSAPAAAWRRIGAFDSAEMCERQRERSLRLFEREAARVRSRHPDGDELTHADERIFDALAACRRSRCVPTSAFFSRPEAGNR